jgi:uncharacterized protein YgbK (DUF1537 family)
MGVIADDVTGACDLADAVREAGGRAVVLIGLPRPDVPLPPCDCAVVGLRTRTAARDRAVADSLAAARWLLSQGASTLYQKYCSTFDSTDEGMIGPVADALRGLLGQVAAAVGTPATPRVGRTVYQGHLFVGDRLLSESSLRHHPLTPMRDSDLVAVLGRQTSAAVDLVRWDQVCAGADAVSAALESIDAAGRAGHVLVDALTDADLNTLAAAVDGSGRPARLLGGAAGLAAALARRWSTQGGDGRAVEYPDDPALPVVPPGPSLVLSGSCSERTLAQVAAFDGPRIDLDPLALAADPVAAVDSAVSTISAAIDRSPVLVSSSAPPEAVRQAQHELGAARAAELLERAAGRIAARAVGELGVRRLLVAGGETSGAVVESLGLGAMLVGPAVAPGVPWMVPITGPRIAVLLKSGNFGPVDLFRTAWAAGP